MRISPILLSLTIVSLLSIQSTSTADTAAEVEQLKAEVALLKMKLDSAEKKLAKGSGQPQTQDNSTGRQPKIKPITDLTEILETFPTKAQPNSDGRWSNAATAEAQERLEYAVWGLPFQRKLAIRSVTVKENPEITNDGSASPWLIEIDFQNELVEYQNAEIRQDVSSIKIYANDQRARRARKIEAGDEMRVRATIVSIRPAMLGKLNGNNPSMFIYVRDVDIPGITK